MGGNSVLRDAAGSILEFPVFGEFPVFSTDGRRLSIVNVDYLAEPVTIRTFVLDTQSGEVIFETPFEGQLDLTGQLIAVRRPGVNGTGSSTALIDLDSQAELWVADGAVVRFSADGQNVFIERSIGDWGLETSIHPTAGKGESSQTIVGRFASGSSDGRFLATFVPDREAGDSQVSIWEVGSGQRVLGPTKGLDFFGSFIWDPHYQSSLFLDRVAFNPIADQVALWTIGEQGPGIYLFNLNTLTTIAYIPSGIDTKLHFDADGKSLYLLDESLGQFGLLDLDANRLTVSSPILGEGDFSGVVTIASAANRTFAWKQQATSLHICQVSS